MPWSSWRGSAGSKRGPDVRCPPYREEVFDRSRRRRDSEHGAVAAVVAILLAAGVLFGSGALVIDVGVLYSEREQLQSGADAASFRIAMDCVRLATTATPCTASGETSVAVTYAQKNALDGKANAQVCLNGSGCPAWLTGTACPPLPTPPSGTATGSYVEVRTSTLTSNNGTVVPPVFGGTLPGINYSGTRVGACGRVNWGPPANPGRVFALGISLCDWKRMTNSGTSYFGPIGTLAGGLGLYTTLGLPNPATAGNAESGIPAVLPLTALGLPVPSCTTPTVDLTVPRGYVWLGDANSVAPDSQCTISVNVGDWAHSNVLAGALSNQCVSRLAALRTAKQPILVPIYDQIQPAVLSLTPGYHIVGFAPFVVTAYTSLLGGLLAGVTSTLSGTGGLTNPVNTVLCGVGQCIYGYFTRTVVPMSRPTFGTGGNYGATVIGRTG